jgi:pyruvate,water dikinase
MGIIIQEMVYPIFSGVLFTRNPLTGLDEIIIESVEGLGEALVQIGETPERWVYKWGEWIEIPSSSQIDKDIIDDLVQEAIKIEKKYGEPLDLEWVYDGKNIYWLQLRKITTLKYNKLYSNKLSKEFMPGMIKPLIWSVNIPVVNTSWKRIFEQLIGTSAKKININQLAHPFYYRSYFNMKIMGDVFELLGMPRDLLENLAGIDSKGEEKPSFRPSGRTFYFLPRILLFVIKVLLFSKNIEKFLRSYKIQCITLNDIQLSNLDEEQSLEIINKLFEINTKASYVVIITQLLNSVYNSFIKNKLKKKGIEFENLELSLLNKRLYSLDPRLKISQLNNEFKKSTEFNDETNYDEFIDKFPNSKANLMFQKFISNFGFLRDSGNDFSQPSWSENPNLMFKMVRDYKEPKINKIGEEELIYIRDKLFKSPLSKILFNRALKYLEYRQAVTNLYSYGYGLFRKFFLRISELFLKKRLLKAKDDIFYMELDEVKGLIKNKNLATDIRNKILKRKKEMESYANLQLPEIIYDDYLPKPIENNKISNELEGVPTSKGFYIGPVKVIKGLKDIDKIQDGDIIAIPYSDVSWTPLFSKAKAVISESGGILSHCSIVAREYKIPAIVSVQGATLLKDDMLIAVDAFKGKVSILTDDFKLDEQYKNEMIELLKH